MNKDDLIREYKLSGASWPAIVGLYAVIVCGFFASAALI